MPTDDLLDLSTARTAADDIIEALQPHCERIEVAGSIRRKKPQVGDIEIICQPTLVADGLFGGDFQRSPAFIHIITRLGKIIKGNPHTGRYVQVQISSITVDIFIPEPHDYFRQLAIRTGSAEYAREVIACGWLRHGWCGTTNAGLRKIADCQKQDDGKTWKCIHTDGPLPPAWESEQEFFQWIGVPWIEPEKREVVARTTSSTSAPRIGSAHGRSVLHH